MLTDLDPDTLTFVHERTVEIKALVKRSVRNVLEVGSKLIQVKERLGHGRFGEWLASEFEWSQDTANNFMRVAQHFGDNPKISEFTPSVLYLLSAPSTPATARREAVKLVEKGETISYAKAKEIVEQHKQQNQSLNVTSFANNDDQAKFDSTEDTAKDDEDLARFEAIANTPVSEVSIEPSKVDESEAPKSKTTTANNHESKSVPFSCLMEPGQRLVLYGAIQRAKEREGVKTTAQALCKIAEWYQMAHE